MLIIRKLLLRIIKLIVRLICSQIGQSLIVSRIIIVFSFLVIISDDKYIRLFTFPSIHADPYAPDEFTYLEVISDVTTQDLLDMQQSNSQQSPANVTVNIYNQRIEVNSPVVLNTEEVFLTITPSTKLIINGLQEVIIY